MKWHIFITALSFALAVSVPFAGAGEPAKPPAGTPLFDLTSNIVYQTKNAAPTPERYFPKGEPLAHPRFTPLPRYNPLSSYRPPLPIPPEPKRPPSLDPEELRRQFNRLYDQYRRLIHGEPSFSSHSGDYNIFSLEGRLLALGKDIIPLLRERAAQDQDGLLALPLIAKLEVNPAFPNKLGDKEPPLLLTYSEQARLSRLVEAVPEATQQEFAALYQEWKEYIDQHPSLNLSSNTHDYAIGPAVERMLALGESIAPLLVKKAQDDFFVLPIYDRIMAGHPEKIAKSAIIMGEQHRAVVTAKLFLEPVKESP